jgi:beta-N-acetylhexosaminidase
VTLVRRIRAVLCGVLVASVLAACGSGAQDPSSVLGSTSVVASSAAGQAPSGGAAIEPSVAPSSAPPVASATVTPVPSTQEPPAPAAAPPAPVPPGGLVTSEDMTQAAAAVAAMSVNDQAGTVVMASSADAVGTDLVGRLHLGGVILMGSKGAIDGTDGGTPDQVKALTAQLQSQVPAGQNGAQLLIATDQEYGLVTRLVNGFTDFPGSAELSGIADTAAAANATKAVTEAGGQELRAVGINVNFAPDADVLPESGPSGVDDRTFGPDPQRSATLVAAAVQGYQQGGVAATIKHFPGIGRLATDTHKALPSLDTPCDEWNTVEAVPMRAGVDAGVALVMTGHVEMPAAGATGESSALSKAVVTELLRGPGRDGCQGLNFHGVTVSDSFQMAPVVNNFGPAEAAWRGLAAGQDLVLMPQDPTAAVAGIISAVGDGSLSAARLQDAATAVYALRLALARAPRPGLEVVNSPEHQAIADRARQAG